MASLAFQNMQMSFTRKLKSSATLVRIRSSLMVTSIERARPTVSGRDWCPDAVRPCFNRVINFKSFNFKCLTAVAGTLEARNDQNVNVNKLIDGNVQSCDWFQDSVTFQLDGTHHVTRVSLIGPITDEQIGKCLNILMTPI